MHMGAAAAAVAVTWLLLSAARAPWRCAGQALVPGVIIFGDSVVDAGNNNRLPTLVRADFPPYGRDFPTTHAPTGRFCNGKLATDYTVENLGFSSYPPAYLSQEAQSDNRTLLHGANFASGASGYLDATAALYGAISLSRQLDYFREFQSKVAAAAGGAKAAALTAGSIYVVSAGTSDYVQNYYVNPVFSATYTPDQFADALMQPFTSFVECERELPSGGAAAGLLVVATDVGLLGVPGGEHGVGPMEACGGSTRVSWACSGLRLLRHAESTARRTISAIIAAIKGLYGLGARRIGVTSLPPTGCLPASITLFGGGGGGGGGCGCVERLNNDSLAFNKKLEAASDAVRKRHPDLKLVVFDIYTPLLDLVSNPTNAGFFEPRRACCGTGTIETSLLCNQGTPGTCANATGYVFWDGFHPTDAANKVLADALLLQGLQLIS